MEREAVQPARRATGRKPRQAYEALGLAARLRFGPAAVAGEAAVVGEAAARLPPDGVRVGAGPASSCSSASSPAAGDSARVPASKVLFIIRSWSANCASVDARDDAAWRATAMFVLLCTTALMPSGSSSPSDATPFGHS